MTRHDTALHEIARDRLYAVAAEPRPGTTAGAGPVDGHGVGAGPVDGRRRSAELVDGHRSSAGRADTGRDEHGDAGRDGHGAVAVAPTGWLPDAPGSAPLLHVRRARHRDDASPSGDPPSVEQPASAAASADAHDVVTRMRAEALGAAAAAYTDTYGHPLEHGRPGREGPRLRWGLTVRHAVVAGTAVAVLATGVIVRAASTVPAEPASTATAVVAATGDPQGGEPGVGVVPAPPGPSSPDAATASSATTTSAGAEVVVHVVGQVAAPGLIALPAGSRVGDALLAVGGASPSADLSAVNLARVVQDGEQIVVPAPGEVVVPPPPRTGSGVGGDAGTSTPLDLNTADGADLDALPGIGPVLAERIVEWRDQNGPFRDVDELAEVSGIGEALMGRLRPLVRV